MGFVHAICQPILSFLSELNFVNQLATFIQQIHLFDFCIENACLCWLLLNNVTKRCTHAHLQLMCHPSTCTDEWCPTANTLLLSVKLILIHWLELATILYFWAICIPTYGLFLVHWCSIHWLPVCRRLLITYSQFKGAVGSISPPCLAFSFTVLGY